MALPTSTVRLQIRPSFDLHAAADACDTLATLGVGAVYLSPLLPSARGSDHGYDVVAFDTIDAARGGMDGWTRLLAAARARGLRVIVDIVPNHCGVADASENRAWWDLLANGRASAYAPWFDVDWATGPILIPILGDGFTPDQLTVDDGELRYVEHRYPIADGTGPRPGDSAADVHDRQHYRLVNFRRADTEQNYRRFFAVSTLAGLRVEDPAVFAATHEQVRRWLQSDGVDGLRVDHPDGLTDPREYLLRLRALAGDDAWITVEKIMEPGEELPADWAVDGTTGYDALTEVSQLFTDAAGERPLTALYREITADRLDHAAHVTDGKRSAVRTILRAEINRLARLVPDLPDAGDALAEIAVAFDVYRTYLPAGAEHLAAALEQAHATRPDLAGTLDALRTRLLDPAAELARRFQQTTSAIMAKGVEDTAYYRFTRFVAANEVGGDPAVLGRTLDDWHEAQHRRQTGLSRSMTTLSTHDTKRSEDVRARLQVLAELPDDWAVVVRGLLDAAPIPDASFAYLLWQTFAGAGFVAGERMHAYAEKAMREAAQSTTWLDPDRAFEATVHSAVDAAYQDPAVHEPLRCFIERITPYGWSNSLSQKLVQLTMPGVPDVYQGTWTWDDSLVDPDNRRPVDVDALRATLDDLDARGEPPPIDATGAAKVWVVSRALRLRRDWPELFARYTPIRAEGPAREHAVAFDRGGAMTVATRLPVGLERGGGWLDTQLPVDGTMTDAISGRRFSGPIALADLLVDYPVALLVR